MIEWPKDEKAPTKFSLTTLRRTMSKKEVVRTVKERYRTLPPRAPANLLRSQGDASGAELALLLLGPRGTSAGCCHAVLVGSLRPACGGWNV
jgi:hypothetical protein